MDKFSISTFENTGDKFLDKQIYNLEIKPSFSKHYLDKSLSKTTRLSEKYLSITLDQYGFYPPTSANIHLYRNEVIKLRDYLSKWIEEECT